MAGKRQIEKVKFPIKYLEENLVFLNSGAVYAYYEWVPYNYSFISEDKALMIARDIERLISGANVKDFHMLDIAVEENIHDTIVRSKKEIRKGPLYDLAIAYMDGIEKHLQEVHGSYEVGYRHYIGFRLSAEDYELGGEGLFSSFQSGFRDFRKSLREEVFGDYTRLDNKEIEKYLRLESLLAHKITRRFKLRRTEPRDTAYIIEHLNGKELDSFDGYSYEPEVIIEDDRTRVKSYDVIRLSDTLVENHKRYLAITTEERDRLVAYLALSNTTGDLAFPFASEILYYQQESFDFPVDTSIKVEVIPNREALASTRNKKAELKDLDESALSSGNESSVNLIGARQAAQELEGNLEREKADMYKISYLVRVSAKDREELAKRVSEVKEYYRNFNMLLERPLGDQAGLHEEFYPGTPRYMNDYIQYVGAEFLSCIGFGAAHKLGEREGVYVGWDKSTGQSVYIKPWLAAQGVAGSVTNALAKAFLGSLGGGKSVTMNLITFYSVLFGGRAFILDPKGERGNWEQDLSFLGEHLNIISVTSGEENRGLCDPFQIMQESEDAKQLALDVLTFMTGCSIHDSERFPVLSEHVDRVFKRPEGSPKGMLCIVEELERTDSEISKSLAAHIRSFSDLGIASLMFGDGTARKKLDINALLNVVLVHDLSLPDSDTPIEKYTMVETLSVAILLVLSSFSLDFIAQDREVYKSVVLDEAWAWLQVAEGKTLSNKLVRAGRSMNAAIDFGTQNCDDLLDEKMKNNIGMKFAFRSRDKKEIEKTLEFMSLEYTDSNIEVLQGLENGDCLYQDIYGQISVIHVDYVYAGLLKTFDTRPPIRVRESEKETHRLGRSEQRLEPDQKPEPDQESETILEAVEKRIVETAAASGT